MRNFIPAKKRVDVAPGEDLASRSIAQRPKPRIGVARVMRASLRPNRSLKPNPPRHLVVSERFGGIIGFRHGHGPVGITQV